MQFDIEYDLIVVGGGAAGKSAAYVAAQAGQRVVILEKMPETGGSSMYAEGIGAFESAVQKKLGKPVAAGFGGNVYESSNADFHFPTREEGYAKYEHYSHGRADYDVVKAFVDHSAETIDMLLDLGANFITVAIPGDSPHDLWTGHIPEGAVARLQDLLLDAVQKLDVDIFCNTPARELITDETGAVVGVVADSEGEPLRVGAKAVILATGGMQDSPEMMEKYSWLGKNARYSTPLTNCQSVGDGMKMALAVGSDPTACSTAPLCFFGAKGKAAGSEMGAAGMQPGALWVNKGGYRFASEGIIWETVIGNVIARQPEASTYTILDQAGIDRLAEQGSEIPLGAFVVIGKPLEHLKMELAQDVADGLAWKGETVEELGRNMGIDAEALAATVAEYNAACAVGEDERYRKDPKYLRAIDKGPFYAIPMGIGYMGSSGGIRINGNMQVVDEMRKPIPGLYATGLDATSLYGDVYNMEVGGSTNGFAHTSGRLAAQHFLSTLA